MNFRLEFENINLFNGAPTIAVRVNKVEYYNGEVLEFVEFDVPALDRVCLEIEHYGKTYLDTEVVDSQIVKDKNFSLKRIIIDGYDIEELKWDSNFINSNNNIIPGCLFFGPNGIFTLEFTCPILKWILSTRHQKNNNDPNWEEDYWYYTKAVNLLKELT